MLTSIVMLTYNKLAHTQTCIDSIREFTPADSYELIVVDNHSTDGTIEWLQQQADIRTIFNSTNQGFPKGCNQGIEMAKGDSILLLNNDTIVTQNWLSNLTTCLFSSSDIGAVGALTNNCSYSQAIPAIYAGTNIRVFLNNGKFFTGEAPGLIENMFRYANFTNVMNKTG
ncbi:glycosyltransferase family 2 protein [bacterium BFN5]|nr:glycosyltransferase family 2 protein [bacterium BFN5]